MSGKMISNISLVLVGMVFFFGCATNSAITSVNKPDRSLIVVPVKGHPINVQSSHAWNIFAGGMIGVAAEQAITADSSKTLCSRLNQDANFNAERILAEECAKILRDSPEVAFRNVNVHPRDSAMSGAEPQRFNVGSLDAFKRGQDLGVWKKSPPVAGKLPSADSHVVFLEVTLHLVTLNHQNRIQPASVFMRLVDSENGKVLGSSSYFESFNITEVTQSSDLRIFEADFRKCMNKCARKALHDLNLL